jgi:hypothetical protein
MTTPAFNASGRMLKAAVMSSMLLREKVDSTLRDMPEVVEPFWGEIAEALMRQISEHAVDCLFAEDVKLRYEQVAIKSHSHLTQHFL